jgi:hypothetical protein
MHLAISPSLPPKHRVQKTTLRRRGILPQRQDFASSSSTKNNRPRFSSSSSPKKGLPLATSRAQTKAFVSLTGSKPQKGKDK